MNQRLNEVPLDVLFSLLNLDQPDESWTFYVNFRARIEDQGLADRLYGAGFPAIALTDLPEYRDAAMTLTSEIRHHVPTVPSVQIGGVDLLPEGGLTGLSHYLQWHDLETSSVEWVVHYHVGGENYKVSPTTGRVPILELSGAARSAIRRLDGLATETAYDRFAGLVSKAAKLPEGIQLIPRKRKVFISYRGSDLAAAEAIYERLKSYGHGAHFAPYLDRHDLALGDLRLHLQARIREADLFVPIVTDSYAQEGSISAEELGWARVKGTDRGEHCFIAPIYIGTPKSDVAHTLNHLVRLQILDLSQIRSQAKNGEDFLRMCVLP
jgi:TIR domain